MIKVTFRQLRGRSQLAPFSFKKVVSAGFTDDTAKEFCITFAVGQKGERRDLSIVFESRTPQIFVSDVYREENEKKLVTK